MSEQRTVTSTAIHILHEHFLGFLIGSYAAAALRPTPGLWLRSASFGTVAMLGEQLTFSAPIVLLGFLLFNAGLGARTNQLRGLLRAPAVLAAGLMANLLVPVAFIFGVSCLSALWHNPEEVQHVLVGLALVAAMPVAGSSAAWSQRANGDLALSLGLVLASTLLSPVTTPLALHAVGFLAAGSYADALHGLAEHGTGGFLAIGVVVPCSLGLLARWSVGEARLARGSQTLRVLASLDLLALNYANAAVSLPQAVSEPDWDFLAVILLVVLGLCAFAFGFGWLLARLFRVEIGQRIALMFGLGMNNNGTGLVLAATALAAHPRVLLPIIGYNLVQHLVAAAVDNRIRPRAERSAHLPLPSPVNRPRDCSPSLGMAPEGTAGEEPLAAA